MCDRYGCSAFGVCIDLGEDASVERNRFIEESCAFYGVVSSDRFINEYYEVWRCYSAYLFELVHEVDVRVHSAGCVCEHHVYVSCLCVFYGIVGD